MHGRPRPDEDRAGRGVRPHPWRAIARVAVRQGQAISVAQLRRCGLSTDQIDRATRSGTLHLVHRGVRAVGVDRLYRTGELWAAVLAVGDGCGIVGDTAAALAGFRPVTGGTIHVGAPTQRRSHAGVAVHHVAGLNPGWLRRREGLPVLRPAHALLDVAADLAPGPLVIALNEAIASRVLRLHELDAVLEIRPGHPGLGRLRAAIAETRDDPGSGRTHSELEDLVLLRLRDIAGLPAFRRNQRVRLAGGRVAKADMLFADQGVMVELDSRRWHEQRRAMDSDRRRDQQALAVGLITFRVTWRHAVHEWPAVAADLTATLSGRAS